MDIVELQQCINIFLGTADLAACRECDPALRGEVDIVGLQSSINTFLGTGTCIPLVAARFSLGSVSGPRGGQVSVPVRFATHAPDVSTIAPLGLEYSPDVLTFLGCESNLIDKTVVANSASPGQIGVVLFADPFAKPPQALTDIPEGELFACDFEIKANAPLGAAAIRVASAAIASSSFAEFQAVGSDGEVVVQ